MSGLLAAAFVVLVSLHPSLAIVFGSVLSTGAGPKSAEGIASWSATARQNLAGFSRGFRFTQQKHICAAAKKRRRTDVETKNPNPRKIYET